MLVILRLRIRVMLSAAARSSAALSAAARSSAALSAAARPGAALSAAALSCAAILMSASPAAAQPHYLYDLTKCYFFPTNYELHVPVAVGLKYDELWPEIHGFHGADFYGEFALNFRNPQRWLYPFDFQAFDGPNFPDPATSVAPAGVAIVEYGNPFEYDCDYDPITAPGNLNTPLPPTYEQAKAAADASCEQLCGPGFVMTDFFYAQWRYACYYDVGHDGGPGANKAFQFATWGGTHCQKPLANGTFQECRGAPPPAYPWAGVSWWQTYEVYRGQPGGTYATAGKLGIGETFGVMFDTNSNGYDAVRNLAAVISNPNNADLTTLVEITHWGPDQPVDCDNPYADGDWLEYITDQENPNNPGQLFADQYCQLKGATACDLGALSYVIDTCRIDPVTGVHSIRIGFGNCMACH